MPCIRASEDAAGRHGSHSAFRGWCPSFPWTKSKVKSRESRMSFRRMGTCARGQCTDWHCCQVYPTAQFCFMWVKDCKITDKNYSNNLQATWTVDILETWFTPGGNGGVFASEHPTWSRWTQPHVWPPPGVWLSRRLWAAQCLSSREIQHLRCLPSGHLSCPCSLRSAVCSPFRGLLPFILPFGFSRWRV